MINTVPASYFANVIPNVLAAGGNGLALVGLFLTTNARVPIGSVPSFTSPTTVGNYFGTSSAEYTAATTYFGGFDTSNIKPGSLMFAQYNTAAVAGYLRGGNVGTSMTLAQLQALAAATLTITTAGTPLTSSGINLSAASSFSNAATIIQAAFTTPPFAVTYDSIAGAFVFTNTATGATSTQAYATSGGTLHTSLMLTAATGAVLSQGAAIAAPAAFMNGIVALTTNWATFCSLFNPDVSGNANKLLFAQWNGTQGSKYMYVCSDGDTTPTTQYPATASLGYLLSATQNNVSGTALLYDPSITLAPFLCGLVASIDYTQTNGNINPTYKTLSGLAATVTTQSVISYLEQNGYNCMVASSTAAQGFTFFWNGQISGQWLWIQPYVNQIWMNSSFQLDLMTLLTQMKSIPYNKTGSGMIQTALMNTIGLALNFGAIQPGVTLSTSQAANVNNAAGTKIDDILHTRGWYLQVLDAAPTSRQARSTPPCNFWYTDGGSVQKISLTSVDLL
jgi:hypothetical protein